MNTLDKTLPSLVIVGNGMVANRFLDELLAREGTKYRITVIGAEPQGSYNRIMLSSVLAKDTSTESIVQKDHDWYEAHNIKLISGTPVTHINRASKHVETACGIRASYDHLVLATGSRAAHIPAENLHLDNIYLFRTLDDTHAMMDIAKTAKSAMVVGGGLLGLEAAYGLAKCGMQVTLVHRSPWLLNRQLDKDAATMLQNTMAKMGITFRLSNEVESFLGESNVTGAKLKSGEQLNIHMAVIATGITPNAELGNTHGLSCKRAIHVDDYMQTSDINISAIGECIEHDGLTFGLVDPLWRQAETLAARLINNERIPFKNAAIATKLKVSGVQVFSAGEVEKRNGVRAVVVQDKHRNVYRKLLIENSRIIGIVLFGDVRSGTHYFDLMQNGACVEAQLPNLLFGQEFVEKSSNETIAA